MPRILNLMVDQQDHVWCDLGRLPKEQGSVTVLTEEEITNIRRTERQRMRHYMEYAVDHEEMNKLTQPF